MFGSWIDEDHNTARFGPNHCEIASHYLHTQKKRSTLNVNFTINPDSISHQVLMVDVEIEIMPYDALLYQFV